jgi:hypothetical protein
VIYVAVSHEFRLVNKYRWIWFLLSNEIDVVVEHLESDITTRVGQQQRTIYLQIQQMAKAVVVVNATPNQ